MILTYEAAADAIDDNAKSETSNGYIKEKSRSLSAPQKDEKKNKKTNDESLDEEFFAKFLQVQTKTSQARAHFTENDLLMESLIGKEANYLNRDIMQMLNEDSLFSFPEGKLKFRSKSLTPKRITNEWTTLLKNHPKQKEIKEICDSNSVSVELSSLSKSKEEKTGTYSLDIGSPQWGKNYLLKADVCKNSGENRNTRQHFRSARIVKEENPMLQYYSAEFSPNSGTEKKRTREEKNVDSFKIKSYIPGETRKQHLEAVEEKENEDKEKENLTCTAVKKNKLMSIIGNTLKSEAFAMDDGSLSSQKFHEDYAIEERRYVNVPSNEMRNIDEEKMGYSGLNNNYISFPMIPQVNIFMNSAGNEYSYEKGNLLQQGFHNAIGGICGNNLSKNFDLNAKMFFPQYPGNSSIGSTQNNIQSGNTNIKYKEKNVSKKQSYKVKPNEMMFTTNKNSRMNMNNSKEGRGKSNNQNCQEWYPNYTEYNDEELAQIASFLVRDQSGCRFLQKKIANNRSFANDILFYYLQSDMLELICDSFGNYLLQKLIDCLDLDKIECILDLISPVFLQISVSPHGTRVVQKIIEKIEMNSSLFLKFNRIFAESLVALSQDVNGNHIVQKYVSIIRYPNNQLAYEIIIKNFWEIAVDKHGCCVLQKCIDEGNEHQRLFLIEIIITRTLDLITEQYGNYVIQYILEMNNPEICRKITLIFLPYLAQLGKQKYSSNVIEKCIDHATPEVQDIIINAIVKNDEIILELLLDSFGNYVLQKVLSLSHGRNYSHILKTIAENINKLKQMQFGSKLIAKLLSKYKELGSMLTNNQRNNLIQRQSNLNAVRVPLPEPSSQFPANSFTMKQMSSNSMPLFDNRMMNPKGNYISTSSANIPNQCIGMYSGFNSMVPYAMNNFAGFSQGGSDDNSSSNIPSGYSNLHLYYQGQGKNDFKFIRNDNSQY